MPRMNEPADVFKLYDMRGTDECWPWLGRWGGRDRNRRPYFMANGQRSIAYRFIYELVHGVTLTRDQLILHSCDNGAEPVGCGNPAHMSLGTHDQNMDQMKRRERHGLPRTVVRAIRKLLAEGRTQASIAEVYGLSREAISAIATERVYSHVQGEDVTDGTDDTQLDQ